MLDKFQKGLSTTATVIIVLIILVGGVAVAYYSGQDQNEPTIQEEITEEDTMENKDEATMEDKEDDAMEDKSDDSTMEEDQGDAMEDKSGDAMTPASPSGQGGEDDDVMVSETKTFNLTGQNFAFSTAEIRVKKGDKVIINFESTGGFHDFTLDGYGIGTQSVNPGTPTSVEFVADQAGAFEYFCSVGNHRAMGMVGQLIVE